jgi:hypothetical protein
MKQMTMSVHKKTMNPLQKNQIIGGICACIVVIFACIRIFVLKASIDGIFANLMSITGAMLSLIVLTSAVRIMLTSKKSLNFKEILYEKLDEIDERYGALIKHADSNVCDIKDRAVYLIAIDNVDAIFTPSSEKWDNLQYAEKFAFSPDFTKTRTLSYFVNHANMKARAARHGDSLKTAARLLARDTAVVIQRCFSDIATVHALEVTEEDDRAVVSILINSTETSRDAERIAELIDYMLFLHFVAT